MNPHGQEFEYVKISMTYKQNQIMHINDINSIFTAKLGWVEQN